ncbi:H-NS family nucleoid-associated regulatory protein [Ralstonia sp. ASV6]|uniref:H-NS histone family protein n=1 Tax=Ralstonia sp. ASV6 TaxID=2795124 RepID=UPI0018EB41E1|nr:H-NS histone family protein [Ralstonia sp. ASV6]
MPSYPELLKKIKELQAQADALRAEERSKAIKEIREQIAEFELTAADLGLKPGQPAAVRKAAKHYSDGTSVWVGRGPRPAWLKAALDAGRKLEEFLVD